MTQSLTIKHTLGHNGALYRVHPSARVAEVARRTANASNNLMVDALDPSPAEEKIIEFVPKHQNTLPHVMITSSFAAQVIGQVSDNAFAAANENKRLWVIENYNRNKKNRLADCLDVYF